MTATPVTAPHPAAAREAAVNRVLLTRVLPLVGVELALVAGIVLAADSARGLLVPLLVLAVVVGLVTGPLTVVLVRRATASHPLPTTPSGRRRAGGSTGGAVLTSTSVSSSDGGWFSGGSDAGCSIGDSGSSGGGSDGGCGGSW